MPDEELLEIRRWELRWCLRVFLTPLLLLRCLDRPVLP